jgi:hypothetical protein
MLEELVAAALAEPSLGVFAVVSREAVLEPVLLEPTMVHAYTVARRTSGREVVVVVSQLGACGRGIMRRG